MTSRGLTVGLFGLLGSGNLGNDASLEAMVAYLRTLNPDARLVAMCAGPERVGARYGVPSIPLHWYDTQVGLPGSPLRKLVGKAYDVVRTAAFVRRCDVVIVPGMGVLETTLPMRPWGWPLTLFLLTASGRLLRTTTALIGVGAAEIRAPVTRRLLVTAARLAHHRSYRDQYSKDALTGMGVDTFGDEVHPDLAFALPEPSIGAPVDRAVGVGVMAFRGDNDDRARAHDIYRRYLSGLQEFVGWLLDRGYRIRLLVGDRVDEEVVAAVLADARRRAGTSPGDVVVESPADYDELLRQVAMVELVVASRFHNVIAALKLGKPTVALGYGAKNEALMTRMGLGDFCQSIRSLDVPMLIDQFTRLEEKREHFSRLAAQRSATCRTELDRALTRLSAALFPPPRG